jgi:hypothetical protein
MLQATILHQSVASYDTACKYINSISSTGAKRRDGCEGAPWRLSALTVIPILRAAASVRRLQTGWTMNPELKSPAANWGAPADAFARLEGDWTLVRHLDGRLLTKGLATFTANDDGRLWLIDWESAYRSCSRRSAPAG